MLRRHSAGRWPSVGNMLLDVQEEAALRAAEGRYDRAIELYEKAATLGSDPTVPAAGRPLLEARADRRCGACASHTRRWGSESVRVLCRGRHSGRRLTIAVVNGQSAGGTVSAARAPMRFTEISHEAGVDFLHVNGASADKHLVETIGSGGLFFDYDNDGWIDIFRGRRIANGSGCRAAGAPLSKSWRWHVRGFHSPVRHSPSWLWDGACAGDYDNDGWVDLYVTSFGSNTLYRNTGTRIFTEVTAAAHVGSSSWSTGCAFADLDRDGDLDLFVTN